MSKIKIGILGASEGNGHPYSFSAILNGYNADNFENTKWIGILNYLQKRDDEEFGALDAKVTHVWCQDVDIAYEISGCCLIDNVVTDYVDMIGHVDAVIIARDDFENHRIMAEPFLKAGLPVMIDKPLTLDCEELDWFMSFYDKGLLFSCSGLRFCQELDSVRENLDEFGKVTLVKASVINDWEKYGVHMLDATLGVWDEDVDTVNCYSQSGIDTFTLSFSGGITFQVNTLGPETFSFSYQVIGESSSVSCEIRDNFSAFKRMLSKFVQQVNSGEPYLSSQSVHRSIRTLIAGQEAKRLQTTIKVNNV
ncbi:Gfo/Idh/MocA family oxidoreductase [Vibrio sp. 2-2(8)]|uniref:Gfo/Idh/MocA family protein n=1 Tax=Vibrio sp. 2-2(8) TaxID=2591014 RepID=UPI001482E0E7|nr:Gfo/Idh/MocA family oxidoreductase [Vibrio sp. 2-2(8)]NNN48630.1 hypothetical protein [Vibrio sp. 2-2(8)]